MQYNPVFIYPKNEADAMNELLSIEARIDTVSREQLLQSKTIIRIEGLTIKTAWKLKQCLLQCGQNCLLNERAEELEAGETHGLIVGHTPGIHKAMEALESFESNNANLLSVEIRQLLDGEKRMDQPWNIQLADRMIDLNERTWIMGILNITPDSFSDGGQYNESVDLAVEHVRKMVDAGADFIDIGGESTRPGAETVSLEDELSRVIPIIKAIKQEVNVPISIDTYKAEVAKQAVGAGADIINDIWGAKADTRMAKVAAELQVPIILMHNRDNRAYDHLMADIVKDLRESINLVKSAGVKEENIILDPGIGFAKTYEDNLEVMNKLETITAMGFPVLLGTSRKSFIGRVLDTETNERIEGTGATTCLGIQKGCQIIRIHDVLENKRMAMMMDAMLTRRTILNG